MQANAGKTIYVSSHAVGDHAESSAARKCMNDNGVFKAFLIPGTKEEHWLCNDNGTIYDTIVSKNADGTYNNYTTFSPKDGTLKAALDWLKNKGAIQIKPPAGPFNFLMP
jgi:hypothetical protein